MKIAATLLLTLFSIHTFAQTPVSPSDIQAKEIPYNLPTPEGWGVEQFPFPIGFAPTISYKGVEDIRFSPGWAKGNSEEYWSYAFLWFLDGDVNVDSQILEMNIKDYYTGLIAANGSKIPTENLIPVITSFKKIERYKDDLQTYSGTIQMTDYIRIKPILLNCKVHLKKHNGKDNTFLFFELSPQPVSHAIWQKLDQLWTDFKCN